VVTSDQKGEKVDLGKELSEGLSLVYFYPKADTPGCTKQACNLRDEFEAVTEAGIRGVSAFPLTPPPTSSPSPRSLIFPSPSWPTRRVR